MTPGAAVLPAGMRTAAHEALAPKYAHIERERRFLVDPDRCPAPDGVRHILIEDRYLTGTRLRLRRMTDSLTGGVALKLTKKYEADDPLARPIVTAYLSAAEYAAFGALPAAPLVKRRYPVAAGGGTFAIDRFAGALAGLVLAELECEDDTALRSAPVPGWAVREVSDDPRFGGGYLAGLSSLAELGAP